MKDLNLYYSDTDSIDKALLDKFIGNGGGVCNSEKYKIYI